MAKPITHYNMIEAFIKAARMKNPKYKGIHTVFSGFNEAFRTVFPGDDPISVTANLAAEGKISVHPAKKGAMIYLAGDGPAVKVTKSRDEILKSLGLA